MADISITAGNVAAGANAKPFIRRIAGATITAGQWLYEDATDSNKAKLADAGAAATAACIGVAMNGAAAGQPVLINHDDDDFTPGGTLSLSVAADSGVYVLSNTAGGIAPMDDLAAGMYPVILGVAKSTTKMVLKIVRSTSAALTA